ncbi:hypothetical protein [Ohtaekwangia sp.]
MNFTPDKPPVFKTWQHWYWLVIGAMIVQIILYYWITRTFA